MAKKPKRTAVETLRHEAATRKNIPTAEYQSVLDDAAKNPIRVAYERRDPDLDPQLVWRGKDVLEWGDLVVQAPPLYIQEKVHPKVLVDDYSGRRGGAGSTLQRRRLISFPTSTESQKALIERSSTGMTRTGRIA
jgi:hypothetical protein